MESKRDLVINQVPITTKPEVHSHYGTKKTLLRESKRDLMNNSYGFNAPGNTQLPVQRSQLYPQIFQG